MKFKSILRDQSFWSLLIINVAIIVYYVYYHTGFKTLVWIYWCQSVMIGLFTYLDLLTLKDIKPGTMELNNQPVNDAKKARGCLSTFFVAHFGFFHLVYFIFLQTITNETEIIDWHLFQFSLGAFFLDQLWNFIRMKNWESTHLADAGAIFFMPYVRVVPMHLIIMIPAFIGAIPQLGLFLILKLLADLAMYVVTVRVYGKGELEDITVLRMGK